MTKEKSPAQPDWNKSNGLLPAIVQHAHSGKVLMQAYMNAEALEKTLREGRLCFFSRSRQRLWTKGESSGHWLKLVDWTLDCDNDSLLFQALPAGPTCHLGHEACFDTSNKKTNSGNFLLQLEAIIAEKARLLSQTPAANQSYTQRLLDSGIGRIAQKVGEEGVETALAAISEPDEALLDELADLYYHSLVLLHARGLRLNDVLATLARRHNPNQNS